MRPVTVLWHLYMLALALAVGLAFGPAWSLIPLAVGLLSTFFDAINHWWTYR